MNDTQWKQKSHTPFPHLISFITFPPIHLHLLYIALTSMASRDKAENLTQGLGGLLYRTSSRDECQHRATQHRGKCRLEHSCKSLNLTPPSPTTFLPGRYVCPSCQSKRKKYHLITLVSITIIPAGFTAAPIPAFGVCPIPQHCGLCYTTMQGVQPQFFYPEGLLCLSTSMWKEYRQGCGKLGTFSSSYKGCRMRYTNEAGGDALCVPWPNKGLILIAIDYSPLNKQY